MTIIEHDLAAACPPDKVWALLADLEAVAGYNPLVKTARFRGPRTEGVGAERECELQPRGKVTERVTVWEEGRALGLEVAESNWPIHFMRWITRIEQDRNGTRIAQKLEYRMKFGPLGWFLDRLVMRRTIRRNVGRALGGLVEKAERG